MLQLLLITLASLTSGSLGAADVTVSEVKSTHCSVTPCTASCESDQHWKGKAEFLYWTTSQSELSYAVRSSTPEAQPIIGNIAYLTFQWEPGFRAGLTRSIPCTCWEVGASFSYVQFRAEGPLVIQPTGGAQYTTFSYPLTDDSIKASAGEKIQYYVLDAIAKRPTCLCWATLSPLFGVRLAQIDQRLEYLYFGNALPQNFANNLGIATLDFKGIGILSGIEGTAQIFRTFSLFGSFGLSILAGRDDNRQRQDALPPITGLSLPPVRLKVQNSTGKGVVDVGAGIEWQWCRLSLKAGYEFHHWFNVAQFVRFLDSTNQQAALPATHGHLSIHGLVLTAAYCL